MGEAMEYQIVVPEGNGYTVETIRERALQQHLRGQLGIHAELDDALTLRYAAGTSHTAARMGNSILCNHYGLWVVG